MMQPIDFERRFQLFALDWLKRHPGLKEDEIDAGYNEMLEAWRTQPADWLDGETPAAYFDKFSDADALVDLLAAYDAAGMELPEALYSRIAELGEASVEALSRLAADVEKSAAARATAMSLLSDIGSGAPIEMCVRLLAQAEEPDELTEAAVRLVRPRVRAHIDALLEAFERAGECGKDIFLDLLCECPGDERVYELACRRFLNAPERRAMCAACLAKLGDARAIEPLQRVAQAADLQYYDYLEIVNAIEALGGEVESPREFYGDPDYEAMRFL